MGKKAFAKKTKPSRRETPEARPQPTPPAPVAQPSPMVSLDAMMTFLRQQDPTRDWTTALTSFGQTGGVGTTSSEAPPTPVSHAAVSVPDSAELDAIATHYDSYSEERKKKSSQVGNREKATSGNIPEGRPFQVVGGEGEVPSKEKEPVDPQVKVGDDRIQVREEGTASTEVKDTGTETAEPEVEAPTAVAPQVVKPIPVRRKLVVKADPKADSPKPQRVSQRCLAAAHEAPVHDQRQEGMEKAVEEIAEESRQIRAEMIGLASDQEQRQARMEKAMDEVREENKQLKAEMVKLA
ncbi:titin-like [Salvia splendens]|uniref:titin-like n=1 Tax=Salvia splendens TaxID=180675 RepID=UPI001C268405|nr:titin-like [Salvia splendens]